MKWLVLVIMLGACSESGAVWPPPANTVFSICDGVQSGESCSVTGWCHSSADCGVLRGCYCNGSSYECHTADTLCDFGEKARCSLEGNAACRTPPVGGICTCTNGQTECVHSCPLAECTDYDGSQCICADGTCP